MRKARQLLPLLALFGCVHAPPPAPVIHEEPMVVNGGDPLGQLLASMNDEELFTKGSSAYAAKNYRVAARAFDRLCDVYPKSKHFAAATYNAGLAHEQLAAVATGDPATLEWQRALHRYRPLLDIEHGTHDQIDAGFRAAECLYHLEQYPQAIALLERIEARTDLSLNTRIEAEDQVGICQVESGQLGKGALTLRDVMRQYESAGNAERLDDYYPAQAQFYLGEIYRTYFEQVVLDPNKPPSQPTAPCPKGEKDPVACDPSLEQLAKDLEYKAEMLLSAQGHYLRAIRIGNPRWATAAGERIGDLYESMYDAMTQAPAPKSLDAEEVKVYRQELRKRVRVLVTKAIAVYEETVESAQRTGTHNLFIKQAKASLERMKAVLLADAKAESKAPPPPPPSKPSSARDVPRSAPYAVR